VVIEPRAKWFGARQQKLIAEFEILVDVDAGLARALRHIGKRFGVLHIFKAALLRKLAPLVRSLGPDKTDQLACTQLVLQLDLDGARIPEWRYLWKEALAPVDLLEAALWGSSFRRIA
jgi:hypothetical protein